MILHLSIGHWKECSETRRKTSKSTQPCITATFQKKAKDKKEQPSGESLTDLDNDDNDGFDLDNPAIEIDNDM